MRSLACFIGVIGGVVVLGAVLIRGGVGVGRGARVWLLDLALLVWGLLLDMSILRDASASGRKRSRVGVSEVSFLCGVLVLI